MFYKNYLFLMISHKKNPFSSFIASLQRHCYICELSIYSMDASNKHYIETILQYIWNKVVYKSIYAQTMIRQYRSFADIRSIKKYFVGPYVSIISVWKHNFYLSWCIHGFRKHSITTISCLHKQHIILYDAFRIER